MPCTALHCVCGGVAALVAGAQQWQRRALPTAGSARWPECRGGGGFRVTAGACAVQVHSTGLVAALATVIAYPGLLTVRWCVRAHACRSSLPLRLWHPARRVRVHVPARAPDCQRIHLGRHTCPAAGVCVLGTRCASVLRLSALIYPSPLLLCSRPPASLAP